MDDIFHPRRGIEKIAYNRPYEYGIKFVRLVAVCNDLKRKAHHALLRLQGLQQLVHILVPARKNHAYTGLESKWISCACLAPGPSSMSFSKSSMLAS